VATNVDAYARIIQRLGQFAGGLDALAHLHAAVFILLVTVTAARAFFVISEMDSGRYAGDEDVATAIAACKWLKWGEAVARLIIIVLLTLFAASFLQIVLPTSTSGSLTSGTPGNLKMIQAECEASEKLVASMGFGEGPQSCLTRAIADLPEPALIHLAREITEPMWKLLAGTYAMMIVWCALVWAASRETVRNRSVRRKALLLQVWIASLSLLCLAVMYTWVELAIARSVSLFHTNVTGDWVFGALSILSCFGIGVALLVYLLLCRRIASDFAALRHLRSLGQETRAGPEAAVP
jgi:hypothetical protein